MAIFSLAHLKFAYDENDGDYWEDRFSDSFDDEDDLHLADDLRFADDHFDVFDGQDEDDDFDGDDLFGL